VRINGIKIKLFAVTGKAPVIRRDQIESAASGTFPNKQKGKSAAFTAKNILS